MKYLEIEPDHIVRWAYADDKNAEQFCHQFDLPSIQGVNAALAANRPLLVRGETGVGKSQLAEAAAWALGRAFYRHVVDARTEPRDLLWRFDAIARLADAQVLGNLKGVEIGDQLQPKNYLRPGPLWWAFDHVSASEQKAGSDAPLKARKNNERKGKGWVLLIDEIDKAESDVPNGLLEALGDREFWPLDFDKPIQMGKISPLIIITTNEERMLPNAFVRRCLVLHLELPKTDAELEEHFVQRGKAHFGDRANLEALGKAAKLTIQDRKTATEKSLEPLPGQAEFLDLMRAVVTRRPNHKQQVELVDEVCQFTLRKHPEML